MDRKRVSHRSCHIQQRGICATLVFLVLIIGTILFAYTAFASSLKDNTIQQVTFVSIVSMLTHTYMLYRVLLTIQSVQTISIILTHDSYLIYVFLQLFRHGDRTPLKTYSSDPYKNYSWPGGWGALTTVKSMNFSFFFSFSFSIAIY